MSKIENWKILLEKKILKIKKYENNNIKNNLKNFI